MERIGNFAFAYCANLSEICFDGNAPEAGAWAFDGIPEEAVAYVFPYATGFPPEGESWNGLVVRFREDLGVDTVTFHTNNANGTLTQQEAMAQIVAAGIGKDDRYSAVFDESVKALDSMAFHDCRGLTDVVI